MTWEEKYKALKTDYDQFAYIFSHDFKAPLRAIGNLAEWIEEDLEDIDQGDIKENLSLLKNRVGRLNKMVDAARNISRIERFDIEKSEFDPSQIIQEVLDSKRIKANLELQVPHVFSYSEKFKSVIEEVVQNALNINEKNVALSINATVENDFMLISISDNGVGIPEEALENITNMFFTIQSKEETTGVGAGLYYVQKTIDFVGGSLTIESQVNIKTTVTIKWPIN